jgi:hypothetical protein
MPVRVLYLNLMVTSSTVHWVLWQATNSLLCLALARVQREHTLVPVVEGVLLPGASWCIISADGRDR